MNKANKKLCELCNGEAALYCSSDSALLCWNCDSKVHAANFLVARHLRSILCSNCTHGISASCFSGYKYHYAHILTPSLCTSCLERDSHSCSSDCISSTDHDQYTSSTTPAPNNNVEVSSKYNIIRPNRSQGVEWRNWNWKAEAVLVNWANKLGISNNRIVVEVGCHAFGMCNIQQSNLKLTAVPYRVGLAASLWLSLRLCEGASSSSDNLKLLLKRLEEISGVSTKLIVAAHTKLSRILKSNKSRLQQQEQEAVEEGWAEC